MVTDLCPSARDTSRIGTPFSKRSTAKVSRKRCGMEFSIPVASNSFLNSLCQYFTVDSGCPLPVQNTYLVLPLRIATSSSPTSSGIGLLIGVPVFERRVTIR